MYWGKFHHWLLFVALAATACPAFSAEIITGSASPDAVSPGETVPQMTSVIGDAGENDAAVIQDQIKEDAKAVLENNPKAPITVICLEGGGAFEENTCEEQKKSVEKALGPAAFAFAALVLPKSKPDTTETTTETKPTKTDPAPDSNKHKAIRNFLATSRGTIIGGVTGLTMLIGQIKSGADPLTVGTAGLVGFTVAARYSDFLQRKNKEILTYVTGQGFVRIDPFKRASIAENALKQAAIPLGLGLLMNGALALSHAVDPNIQLGQDFGSPEMMLRLADMAGKSVYLQLFWQRLNRTLTDEAIARNPRNRETYLTRSALSSYSLAMILAMANASHLSGNHELSTWLVGTVGTAGLATYLMKDAIMRPLETARRVAAQVRDDLKDYQIGATRALRRGSEAIRNVCEFGMRAFRKTKRP